MAEIKIRKKSPIWPWILLLIVIILGVVYYLYYIGDDLTDTDDSTLEQIDDDSYNSTQENREWDEEVDDSLSLNFEDNR
ncbi:MAG: hypothetical protein R6U03_04180 [Gillisia sp.]